MALENMRSMLRGNLGRSLHALTDEDRLAAAWPVACGRAMAEHGEIIALFEGTVTVQVSDAPWLAQMLSMRYTLQNELVRIARVKVVAIHFELKKR